MALADYRFRVKHHQRQNCDSESHRNHHLGTDERCVNKNSRSLVFKQTGRPVMCKQICLTSNTMSKRISIKAMNTEPLERQVSPPLTPKSLRSHCVAHDILSQWDFKKGHWIVTDSAGEHPTGKEVASKGVRCRLEFKSRAALGTQSASQHREPEHVTSLDAQKGWGKMLTFTPE